jgi:hypothetical protein
LIKTIFKNFPNIYTYLGTNLRYIPVVISKSAHPVHIPVYQDWTWTYIQRLGWEWIYVDALSKLCP